MMVLGSMFLKTSSTCFSVISGIGEVRGSVDSEGPAPSVPLVLVFHLDFFVHEEIVEVVCLLVLGEDGDLLESDEHGLKGVSSTFSLFDGSSPSSLYKFTTNLSLCGNRAILEGERGYRLRAVLNCPRGIQLLSFYFNSSSCFLPISSLYLLRSARSSTCCSSSSSDLIHSGEILIRGSCNSSEFFGTQFSGSGAKNVTVCNDSQNHKIVGIW